MYDLSNLVRIQFSLFGKVGKYLVASPNPQPLGDFKSKRDKILTVVNITQHH